MAYGWLPIVLALGSASLASACSPEGSRLARDDTGGAGGQGATTATGTGLTGAGGQGGGTGGAGGDPEPPGPTKLTVVNGIVDYDAIRLCFQPYPAATGGGDPWPGPSGLAFARGQPIDPISDVVQANTDIQLFVVAGNLAQTTGQSCDEVLSGDPPDAASPVLVASAGVLPESVFLHERSLLLALHGCLGGAEHVHESPEQICGSGYAHDAPNVAVAAGFMSRQTSSTVVGMQFVQASAATPTSDLRVRPGVSAAVAYLAVAQWSLGAIAPYPPWWTLSRPALGNVPEATLELYTGVTTLDHTATFAEALANSDLAESDLVSGEGFVFVAVGASHTLPPEPGDWWHPLTYTVLRADP